MVAPVSDGGRDSLCCFFVSLEHAGKLLAISNEIMVRCFQSQTRAKVILCLCVSTLDQCAFIRTSNFNTCPPITHIHNPSIWAISSNVTIELLSFWVIDWACRMYGSLIFMFWLTFADIYSTRIRTMMLWSGCRYTALDTKTTIVIKICRIRYNVRNQMPYTMSLQSHVVHKHICPRKSPYL